MAKVAKCLEENDLLLHKSDYGDYYIERISFGFEGETTPGVLIPDEGTGLEIDMEEPK